MKRRIFLLLIGLIFIFDCFADEQRSQSKFESKNGEYSIKYQKKKWILTDKKGSVRYKLKDFGFTSMTILVSDNGQNIVVINDYIEGHKIGKKNALWLYQKGKLLKSYKLTELINDTCNVAQSIWHTNWSYGNFEFTDNLNHFSLTTYELSEILFDLTTGQIISNRKPTGFDSNCLIVFGEFRKGKENYATMKILKYIAGVIQENNKVSFRTRTYGAGLWRELLMIKNGIDITPDKYRGNIYLNTCLNE
ncbi:MAG: hypothetical protein PHV20_13215 [Bacteroidales bacterium]|nr:hypothetical protein [Bacteroidales bacterium]